MTNSGFGSFLAGIVIGGFVGAAIGLLIAPETGDQMRDHVGEFVDAQARGMRGRGERGPGRRQSARAEAGRVRARGGAPEGAGPVTRHLGRRAACTSSGREPVVAGSPL